ncbi:unnamed protein product [Bemisia tabaci]|uniref:Uncharacterized protein n=1 Tax=Bemisia tabaci TaxID=7038 RepID=A0A9P0F0D9_BEMTA|nr:unnamed protein product [Bemisia tabaci]
MSCQKLSINVKERPKNSQLELTNERRVLQRGEKVIEIEVCDLERILFHFKSNNDPGFVYLVHALPKTSPFFSPFLYKRVSFEKVDKHNYLTISKRGVLQYTKNHMQFTKLDEFRSRYEAHSSLMKVRRQTGRSTEAHCFSHYSLNVLIPGQ